MNWTSSSGRRVGPLLIEVLGVLLHKFNGASQVAMDALQQMQQHAGLRHVAVTQGVTIDPELGGEHESASQIATS